MDTTTSTATTPATTATTAPATTTPATTATETSTATTASTNFRDFIGDDGKFKAGWTKSVGIPDTFEKFTEPKAIFGSHVSLEKMIGAKGVVVPGPNATPAERDAYFKALGRPDKPEDYGLKAPDKIGDKAFPKELWNDDRAKAFAAHAHTIGLSKEQVAALVQFDASQGLSVYEKSAQATQEAIAASITALKEEWGANYEANIKLAKTAAKQAGGDELLAHPLANDPLFIKAMAKVGGMIVENPAAGARNTQHHQVSPEQEIAQIMADKNHPWQPQNAKLNPKAHADAVEHMAKLYKLKHNEAA